MNLETIEKEIIRTEQKIEAYKEKVKALKIRKIEEENAQIIKLVRSTNMSVSDLQEMFVPARSTQMEEDEEDV